ncbi:tetratricopeptide repeat protein [Myroides indicus]|uniref:Tetratricopeptide repeat protein n=1 Tax=Myroides indicus TaxID=1323422 RepID=A0A4R7F5E2_9FLAO|nr:tetratricopeptide repeat protein [Myroides indicus]TDS58822.1 tetratricopeptide repeat protein [Myroides indicus]
MKYFKLLSIFLFFVYTITGVSQQNLHIQFLEGIKELNSDERIRAFATYLDTLPVFQNNLGAVELFLAESNRRASTYQDQVWKAYIKYAELVKETYTTNDSYGKTQLFKQVINALENDKRYWAVAKHFLGQEYFKQKEYAKAFLHLEEANRAFKEIGYEKIPEIERYLHGIALDYYLFHDYVKAKDFTLEALQYPAFNKNYDMQRYNTLALCYEKLEQRDSARYYFHKALDLAKSYADHTWIGLLNGNIGDLYFEQQKYQSALDHYLINIQYNNQHPDYPEIAQGAAIKLAKAYVALGELEKARQYILQSEEIERHMEFPSLGQQQRQESYLKNYYWAWKEYYIKTGQLTKVIAYQDSLYQLDKYILTQYNRLITEVAHNQLQLQYKTSELRIGKTKERALQAKLALTVTIIILILVLVGVSSYYWVHRQKRLRELHRTKESLWLSKQENLEIALSHAKKEMEEQLKHIQQKNKMIHSISEQLEQVQVQNANNSLENDGRIQNILAELHQSKLLTNEEWATFLKLFDTVYPGKILHLRQNCAEITPSDERIFALLQLQKTTKEMADTLGISPESVRKAKYRLRKKLGPHFAIQ